MANIPVWEQREALLRSFKRQYLGKGYIEDDWEGLIGGKHLDAAFTTFMNCGTALDKKRIQDCVREGLLTGNLIRYEVYDDSFARQGEALLEITEVDHVRDGHILCRGRHLAASDPEYHEWALRHMSDVEKALYHVCAGEASRCGWSRRGKRVVHISKFCLVSLQEACMIDWCSCACQEQVRLKILEAPQIKKRKIGKQATEKEALPPEPPNADGVRQVAQAKHHGDRVREALLSGQPNLLDQVSEGGLGVPPSPGLGGPSGVNRDASREEGKGRGDRLTKSLGVLPRPRRGGDVQTGLAALAADAARGRQPKTAGFLQDISSDDEPKFGDGRGSVIVVEGVIQAEAVRVVRLPAL